MDGEATEEGDITDPEGVMEEEEAVVVEMEAEEVVHKRNMVR